VEDTIVQGDGDGAAGGLTLVLMSVRELERARGRGQQRTFSLTAGELVTFWVWRENEPENVSLHPSGAARAMEAMAQKRAVEYCILMCVLG